MSYEVLARKWRPRTFSTLEGQDHVVRALTNALDQDRVHHAFLFTGTRGVGKTTVARIFAKALNCEQGVTSEPCGRCESCTAIDAGRFIDLMEIDAASRTGVDNMRELLDNVQYAPSSGRFKVYLIDEVHMLSTHSFNALLKTLEEPPPHVKFLLATTDPQKLLPTVLSRCLQFNLKRLPMRLIADHLGHILEEEGVAHEPAALNALARAADGSMRDGLTLLDQAIAFSDGTVTREGVDGMLGSIGRDHIHELINAVAAGDGPALLAAVDNLAQQVPHYGSVLAELIGLLQRAAVVQAVPDAAPDDWDDREVIVDLAARLSAEAVQLYYQIALNGRRDLPHAPDERAGFEMIMLRMLAFRPDDGADDGAAAPGDQGSGVATPKRSQAAGHDRGAQQGRGGASATTTRHPVDPPSAPATQASGQERHGTGSGHSPTVASRRTRSPALSPDEGMPGEPPPMEEPPPWGEPEPPSGGRPNARMAKGADPAQLGPERYGLEHSGPQHSGPQHSGPQRSAPEHSDPVPDDVAANDSGDWHAIVTALDLRGMAAELANNCTRVAVEGDKLTLAMEPGHDHLKGDAAVRRFGEALSHHMGRPVQLRFITTDAQSAPVGSGPGETVAQRRGRERDERMQQAREAIYSDPNVKAMVETFDATVVPDSIVPID